MSLLISIIYLKINKNTWFLNLIENIKLTRKYYDVHSPFGIFKSNTAHKKLLEISIKNKYIILFFKPAFFIIPVLNVSNNKILIRVLK